MHRELSATYGMNWYDNPACGFDTGTLERTAHAKDKLHRDGYTVDPQHVVASLSFGFWVALLGKGLGKGIGGAKCNYEMTLWRPCLYRAFPHAKMRRTEIHKPIDYLRTFRNRIAHHEPIFTRHLEADYRQILTITGWMCPSTRD
ncbi:hypothetical protein CCP3SC15_1260006 [Gammaproteobacteria bacterium]